MPVQACQSGGKPGYKWGSRGKCYTYNPNSAASRQQARAKAAKQGRAVEANRSR